MKFKNRNKARASLSFKTGIRGRKLLRKQKRQQKKQNRASFAARLCGSNVEGRAGQSDKIKHLKAMVENEKEKMKMQKPGKPNETKTSNITGEKSEIKVKKGNNTASLSDTENENSWETVIDSDGFQPSASSKTERMAQLQEFVNREAGLTQPAEKSKTPADSETNEDNANLIKDKKKLNQLRKEQKEDTKEINKLARLMHMSKPQKSKVAPIFADDFGSLLRDIEQGTMSHADKYKADGDDGDSDEFERDMATALGMDTKMKKGKKMAMNDTEESEERTVSKKGKKIKKEVKEEKKTVLTKKEKDKGKKDLMMKTGNLDPENEFTAKDFNLYGGGNMSEDDEGDYFFDDDGYDDYTERRGEDDSDCEDEGKFSSDDGDKASSEWKKEGKKSLIQKDDSDNGEYDDSKFSSDDDMYNEEEVESEEGEYAGIFSEEEKIDDEEEEVDENVFFDSEAEDDEGEQEEEEEEEDGKGFIDSEAEEDDEAEESDDDGVLEHDIRKEEEYAFEGGSGYYSKPEILKNGMENDIDRYSSNSDDDIDLEGFVIGDDEVEFEHVSDELPDELSDSPSPVKMRKRVRVVLQSDDDSDGKDEKKVSEDEGKKQNEDSDDGKGDFFFSARGWKIQPMDVNGKKPTGENKNGKTNNIKSKVESSDEDADDEVKGGLGTKEKELNIKKRKMVIDDESDITNSSPEKEKPETTHNNTKKIKMEDDDGDNLLSETTKVEKDSEEMKVKSDDSKMDASSLNASVLTTMGQEGENDADGDTDSGEPNQLVKGKKKKLLKKMEKNEGNSTLDEEVEIVTKKKMKELDEDGEEGDGSSETSGKKKKMKKVYEDDDSTMDGISDTNAKKKKKKTGENEDESTMDSVLGTKTKKKKKGKKESEDGNISETNTKKKMKEKKLEENEDGNISEDKKKKDKKEESEDSNTSEAPTKMKKTKELEDSTEGDSTVDDNASQTKTKKKKKMARLDVAMDDNASQPKTGKKTMESTSDESTMDDDALAKTTKKKGKKAEYDENESAINSEDGTQMKTKKKKKGIKDDSAVDSEDAATTKKKKDEMMQESEDSQPPRKMKMGKRKLEESTDDSVDGDDAKPVKAKKKKTENKELDEEDGNEEEEMKENKEKLNEKIKKENVMKKKVKKLLPLPEVMSSEEDGEEGSEEDGEESVKGEEVARKRFCLPKVSSSEEEEEEEEDTEEDIEEEEEEEDEDAEDMEDEDMSDNSDLEEIEEGEEEEEEGENSKNGKTQNDDLDTFTEDIYGRLRDKHGNIVTGKENDGADGTGGAGGSRYIPPALRKLNALNQSKEQKEKLIVVKRTLKGLVNRLAESNMGGIASEIEGMYARNARNDVNEVLTALLMEAVVGPTMTPERLVQELALLVALLSANVGSEVGAHILNEFVLKWSDGMDHLSHPSSEDEVACKELDNLTLFIIHLYAFRVVEVKLIYDMLQRLARGFSEKEVEIILLVLRSVGFNLRKDDPLALKALIMEIQTRAAEARRRTIGATEGTEDKEGSTKQGKTSRDASGKDDEGMEYSRITFMLETIQAVRNNNMSKIPNYDPSHMDHLRQVLRGLVRKGRQPAQLNVTLDDMLKARECGRWWVVGSAWSGGLVENQEGARPKKNVREVKYSDAFMQKAAKLQLSRPPRVNILYVLTEGSEDYLDAFEKLLQLSLPPQQEREVFAVLLLCSQKGKTYNPFFSYLADRMCKYDKKYVRLLQFALWDKFEEVEAMKVREVANLAKFITHLIGENSLNLTVFKNVSFMDAERQMISLIRQVLIALLLHPAGSETVERTFSVLSSSPKLRVLRQSLRVFILKFVKVKKGVTDDVNYAMLSRRIDVAVGILGSGGAVRL